MTSQSMSMRKPLAVIYCELLKGSWRVHIVMRNTKPLGSLESLDPLIYTLLKFNLAQNRVAKSQEVKYELKSRMYSSY